MHRRTFAVFACMLPWLTACGTSRSIDPASAVTGTIRQVLVSNESGFFITAVITMQNHFSQPVSVKHYRLEWPGGHYNGSMQPLKLAAGESRDWRVRLDYGNGDIRALLDHPEKARVVMLDVRY